MEPRLVGACLAGRGEFVHEWVGVLENVEAHWDYMGSSTLT